MNRNRGIGIIRRLEQDANAVGGPCGLPPSRSSIGRCSHTSHRSQPFSPSLQRQFRRRRRCPAVTWDIVFVWTNRDEQVRQVTILFSGPPNTAQANKLGPYHLVTPGPHGSFSGPIAKVIPLRSAEFDAGDESVTLTPKRPFNLTKVFQLRVDGRPRGGLRDSTGRLIDGDNNGRPGGDVAVVLWHPGVTFSAAGYAQQSQYHAVLDS